MVGELSELVPRSCIEKRSGEKCHRAKVLRYAIEYIKSIRDENSKLKQQLGITSPEMETHENNNGLLLFSESLSSSSAEDSDTPAPSNDNTYTSNR